MDMVAADYDPDPDDFTCPICRDLLYKPVVTGCGHVFCFWCLHSAMGPGLTSSCCPYCRCPFMHMARVCEVLHAYLSLVLPDEYEARREETAAEEKRRNMFSPEPALLPWREAALAAALTSEASSAATSTSSAAGTSAAPERQPSTTPSSAPVGPEGRAERMQEPESWGTPHRTETGGEGLGTVQGTGSSEEPPGVIPGSGGVEGSGGGSRTQALREGGGEAAESVRGGDGGSEPGWIGEGSRVSQDLAGGERRLTQSSIAGAQGVAPDSAGWAGGVAQDSGRGAGGVAQDSGGGEGGLAQGSVERDGLGKMLEGIPSPTGTLEWIGGQDGSLQQQQQHQEQQQQQRQGVRARLTGRDFQCMMCGKVLCQPVVLNCGHAYCLTCIENRYHSDEVSCMYCCKDHPEAGLTVCTLLEDLLARLFSDQSAVAGGDAANAHARAGRSCGKQELVKSGRGRTAKGPWSEEKQRAPPLFAHFGIECDGCGLYPIMGKRYECMDCVEEIGFDLCGKCYALRSQPMKGSYLFNQRHTAQHRMQEVPQTPTFLHNVLEANPEINVQTILSFVMLMAGEAEEGDQERGA